MLTTRETTVRKRLRAAAVGCGLALVCSATTPATASPAQEAEPRVNCFSSSANNNHVWQNHRSDGNGHANWHERGDRLTVLDDDGGAKTVAWLWICHDQRWKLKGEYLDGGGDWEEYNFDFKEKRRIKFVVCQYVSPGRGEDCSTSAEYGNA
jgi:hypothetical protein